MKTILIPVDFSKYGNQAVKAGVRLAQATGAKVIFLHNVYTEKNWESLTQSVKEEDAETFQKETEGNKKMKTLMNSALIKSIRASSVITYGIAWEEIVRYANTSGADLILIGSHTNENPDRPFIGSTIQRVLRGAACPVLMVKKDFQLVTGMKVALATDLGAINQEALKKMIKLLQDLKAVVYLVYVNQPTNFMDTRSIQRAMDALIKKFPKLDFRKVIYNHVNVDEGILQFSEDNHMNCIALVTHNRKGKPKYQVGNTEIIGMKFSKPVFSMNILPEPYPVD